MPIFNKFYSNQCEKLIFQIMIQIKIEITLDKTDDTVKTRFKFGAALELCLDLFLAEICVKIFETDNTIISETSRYLTHLKMKIQKETHIDEVHRSALLKLKEISKFNRYANINHAS